MSPGRDPAVVRTASLAGAAIWLCSPLAWPAGRARSALQLPDGYRHPSARLGDFDDAMQRLQRNIWALGITGDVRLSFDHSPGTLRDAVDPADAGVACAFEMSGGSFVLACDGWVNVANNIASIAAHLDAIRWTAERGIVGADAALRGFAAPVAPAAAAAR